MITLNETAAYVVAEQLAEHGLDFDRVRDAAHDALAQTADDLCIYTHACLDYIAELEQDYGTDAGESGQTFEAHQWAEAARSYAYDLVYCALSSMVEEAVDEAEQRYQDFAAVVEQLGGDIDKAHTSTDCAYGWSAHNRETFEGVHIWDEDPRGCFPGLLEGELLAVSHQIAPGLWANICWTPARAAA